MEHIVLVCGGRHYRDYRTLWTVMDGLSPQPTRVVSGGATGADFLAEIWAFSRGIPIAVYPADWKAHGYAAGPIRNGEMLAKEHPHLVVAFPGGDGTSDMKRQSRKAGVEVLEVK